MNLEDNIFRSEDVEEHLTKTLEDNDIHHALHVMKNLQSILIIDTKLIVTAAVQRIKYDDPGESYIPGKSFHKFVTYIKVDDGAFKQKFGNKLLPNDICKIAIIDIKLMHDANFIICQFRAERYGETTFWAVGCDYYSNKSGIDDYFVSDYNKLPSGFRNRLEKIIIDDNIEVKKNYDVDLSYLEERFLRATIQGIIHD